MHLLKHTPSAGWPRTTRSGIQARTLYSTKRPERPWHASYAACIQITLVTHLPIHSTSGILRSEADCQSDLAPGSTRSTEPRHHFPTAMVRAAPQQPRWEPSPRRSSLFWATAYAGMRRHRSTQDALPLLLRAASYAAPEPHAPRSRSVRMLTVRMSNIDACQSVSKCVVSQ